MVALRELMPGRGPLVQPRNGTASRTERMVGLLPVAMRRKVEPVLELVGMVGEVGDTRAVAAMAPSAFRGMVLRQGRRLDTADIVSGHSAHFDWTYRSDFPEMRELYTRAKQGQWDADTALDWSTHVDTAS